MPALLCVIYLAVALIGYAALSLVLGDERRHWAQIAGLSFAAGAGIVGVFLFIVSIAGFVPNRAILLALCGVSLAILVWDFLSRRYLRAQWPGARGRFDNRTVLAFGAAALMCVVFALASRADVTPGLANIDAYGMWMFKANVIAVEPLRPLPRLLTDPALSFSHQDYPFGYPMLVAGIYAAIGRVDVQLGKTVIIPIFAALIAVVYSTLRSMLRRADSVAITAIFAASPIIAQNASLPVAELLFVLQHTCSLVLLLEWMQRGRRGAFMGSAAFAALAAFTKNEGLALLPLVGGVALIWIAIQRTRKLTIDWICGVAMALIILAPWLIFRRHLPHTHEDYGSKLTSARALIDGASRLPVILQSFLGHFAEINRSGGLWPLLAIFAALGWRAFRQPIVILFWVLLLGHVLLYVAAFMVTPWDLNVLIPMISARLTMHFMPTGVILLCLHARSASGSFHPASASTS